MKHLKAFENMVDSTDIEVGDYLLLKVKYKNFKEGFETFMNNNICRLLKEDDGVWEDFLIGFEDVPEEFKMYFYEKDYTRKYKKIYYIKWVNSDRVIEHGKSPEEVTMKKNMNKYNL